MTEASDALALRWLERIDRKLDDALVAVGEVTGRMTGIQAGLAGVDRRLDRLDDRIERIETHFGRVGWHVRAVDGQDQD